MHTIRWIPTLFSIDAVEICMEWFEQNVDRKYFKCNENASRMAFVYYVCERVRVRCRASRTNAYALHYT